MSSRICFDDMYVFTKVAENSSITLASKKLGMSKQTVSRKISKLEESLNILLIARTTRNFNLTLAGMEYYKNCANIFSEVEKINDVISKFQSTPSGTVKIGTPVFFPFSHIACSITQYLRVNKGINIHISYNYKESDLVNKNIDIAFRVGALNDSSMVARRIDEIKFVYVASKEYLEKYGTPKKHSDLKRHNIVEIENFFHYENLSYKQKVTSENFYIAMDFVIRGFGISIIPVCMASGCVFHDNLVILEDEEFSIVKDISIVFLATRHLPRQVRELIDFVVSFSH